MPFATQLYKKNQTAISGQRQRSIENLCLLLVAVLAKYWLLNWKKSEKKILQKTAGPQKARGP